MTEPLSQAAAWPPGSTTPPRLQAPPTAWWALAAQLAGMFMALLDSTVVNVALPSQSQPGGRRQGADAHAVAQGDAHIGTGEHRRNAGRPAQHCIPAAFNEYRSNADGADISYKMGQKARNGGTLTRAKIGY